ncbi:RHS repeat-associated core domain-containing protein [Leeuwenhoekiella sp. H156]|uniref:RHS repeat-associated core domain-containing protein n=1 Tax=Leeuwenhoekiella sp. H156 TaxID=3450128 RepID=UPI003FA430C8
MQKVILLISIFFITGSLFSQTTIRPIDEIDCDYPLKYYRDQDGDGWGQSNFYIETCDPPHGYASRLGDCNDSDANIYPGATELADGKDNDCDGSIDEGLSPPDRPTIQSITNNCGSTTIRRNSPPSGVTWYWQSSSTGTSTGSASYSVTRTSGTRYYLRARDNASQVWSTALTINYTVDAIPRWYSDFDGDGFGDPNVSVQDCDQPNGYVSDNRDQCPDNYGENLGCPVVEAKEDRNWLLTKTYNVLGQEEAKSKTYYNSFGNMEQSQVWDKKTDSVWASEVRYDSQGRPKLSTISAPIKSGDFLFKPDFIKREDGATLAAPDYDNDSNTLIKVGEQSNSLGWYYSNRNTRSKYQDVTDYPYAKTIYSKLIPGETLKTIGGNQKGGDWKQGYSFTMLAGQELTQSVAFNDPKYNSSYLIFKTVVRDVHGNESVVFEDADGKTLAAARSGGTAVRSSQVKIGKQGFIDVHIPSGLSGLTISNFSKFNLDIYDLTTEELISTPHAYIPSGFYRISVRNTEYYDSEDPILVTYKENYYDYSLNKYDKAGRLISTTQPLGDELKSIFKYNSLGQLEYTSSPDEGEAWFKYRKDGQIAFSQNSKQKNPDGNKATDDAEFSFTEYDDRGRPVRSGVWKNSPTNSYKGYNFSGLNGDEGIVGQKWETQNTTYDKLSSTDLSLLASVHSSYASPGFLAGNVAKTSNSNSTTYYSYDVYGRVTWMVQTIAGLGTKTMDYSYDPVTSEVLRVDYQKHVPTERFIHKYTYNTVGQLTEVQTGASDADLKVQSTYDYYETGALRRKEIGNGLQGMDYVYTLEGALKSINHPDLTAAKDPGGDENDLFGMTIHYNSDDYLRTGTPKPIDKSALGTDQYNGNIKGIEWKTHGMPKSNYYYDYNRNNWLEKADFNLGLSSDGTPADLILESPTNGDYRATNSITLKPGFVAASGTNFSASIGAGSSSAYRVEGITYDANGNILKLKRNSATGQMDNLTYNYKADKNQLDNVDDAVTGNADANDIKDQNPGNYTYNKIGQLTQNTQDGTTYIYNTAGLVTEVTNGSQSVRFAYDDKGQRVKKEVWNGSTLSYTNYYVRDAAGSVLAIYTGNNIEHPVYGASRIGVAKRTSLNQTSFADNNYLYELTDHLGNVRAVAQKNGSQAVAIVKTDYYPFGMPLPGRDNDGNQSQYRYKYQGQEKDSETGKEAFELRLWDARIGRWLTTDPYGEFHSPYLGMGNNPVSTIDIDGGCTDCTACPEACLKLGIEQVPNGQGIGYDFDSDTYSLTTSVLGANLLETVVIGDVSYQDFVGVKGTIEMFFPQGQNPILSIDRELKEQWKGLGMMTNASIGAGYSAAFPTVFANARTQKPRQYAFSGGLAASAGTKTINYTVNANRVKMAVDVAEDNYVIMSGTVHGVKTQVGGFFSRNGNTITINGADFAGEIGITGIRNFAREFANANGASNVIINTAKRTTGANPGKVQHFNFKF